MEIGLLGFPKVGKTSLFNILTGSHLHVEKFSTGKAEPHLGIAKVPDPRLDRLVEMFKPRKVTPAVVEYLDVQGLSKGEAKDPLFLKEMRNVDAIAHVVRCFQDRDVPHVLGSVDPVRDREIVETELALADLETVERRREKVEKKFGSPRIPKTARPFSAVGAILSAFSSRHLRIRDSSSVMGKLRTTELRYGATRSCAIRPGTKTISASWRRRTARSVRSSGFPGPSPSPISMRFPSQR